MLSHKNGFFLALIALVIPFSVSAKQITSTVSSLNIRSAPSAVARVLERAKLARVFTVTEERPQWYRVSWTSSQDGSARAGWLMRKYVKDVSDPVAAPVQRDLIPVASTVPAAPVVCPADTTMCEGQCWSNCPNGSILSCAGGIYVCNYAPKTQILPTVVARTREQDMAFCNKVYWSQCPAGQDFVCPATGNAYCRPPSLVQQEDPALKIAQCQALTRVQIGSMKQALYKQAEDGFGENIAAAEEGIRKNELAQLDEISRVDKDLWGMSPEQQSSIRRGRAEARQPTVDYYRALKQKNIQLLQGAKEVVDRNLEQLYNESYLKCLNK